MAKNFKFTFYNIVMVIFLLYGIGLFIFGGYQVGNLMVLMIGVVLAFFYFCDRKNIHNKFITFLKIAVAVGILITLSLVIFITFSYGVPVSDKKEDAVIVLGCGLNGSEVSDTLRERLNSCIEYSKENPDAVIVVSGGQGFTEEVTEAYAMKKYLIDNGVSEEKILEEPASSSTYENFVNSKKILDNYFKNKNPNYKTAFITNRFHCYRAYNLAKNAGINVSCFYAPDEWKSAIPSYLRESLAVIKLWVLGI